MILRLLLLIVLLYVCAIVFMWIRQEHYLFLPKHYDVLPEFERFRWDRTINGVPHQGWFLDKGKTQTVIYHGGNAEDLAGHCEVMMDGIDANVLLVNYRGYGQSEGAPGEKEMVSDCIAIFDLFCAEKNITPSNIVLMGRSMGTGVAIQVAAAHPDAAGLILVTPYESIAAVARFQYPWLPIKQLMRHPFRAIDFAPQIKMPALVILSEFDEVIPVESGRRLGEALGGPKEIITLPMGHNDINEHPGYFATINRFLKHQ
ncbi:MAG: alpha/beta fold hydrolase [Kiritimatiellales bacterium]